MAAFFLLLCILVVVVIGDALVENTEANSVTLFNQSFDQLSGGELLAVSAGLGLPAARPEPPASVQLKLTLTSLFVQAFSL